MVRVTIYDCSGCAVDDERFIDAVHQGDLRLLHLPHKGDQFCQGAKVWLVIATRIMDPFIHSYDAAVFAVEPL